MGRICLILGGFVLGLILNLDGKRSLTLIFSDAGNNSLCIFIFANPSRAFLVFAYIEYSTSGSKLFFDRKGITCRR